MTNKKIRTYAEDKNVYLWQIAKKLEITDSTLSRRLRNEFSKEETSKIISIIDEIAKECEEIE